MKDGREIGASIKWYPKLAKAAKKELMDFTISPSGYGVQWEKLDEDLSAYGMLHHQEQNAHMQ